MSTVLRSPRRSSPRPVHAPASPPTAPAPSSAGDATAAGQLRSDLRFSHFEGIAFGAMVGLGETYLPAFVLAAGLGEVMAGLVASVPMVAGGLMQLVSPIAIQKLGSHRRWVILCAATQALSFVPLVWYALYGGISAATALLVATIYWGGGLATGPAWNTWMGTVVPRTVRATFFARRTRLSQAAVLLGFLVGGGILQYTAGSEVALAAFALLFALAGVFRLGSSWCLSRQSEPIPLPAATKLIKPRAILHQFTDGPGAPLLLYLVMVQGAVQFSGPYFAPFMFRHLHLSYGQFVLLIATSFVAKIISLPTWGHLAKRMGAQTLLWIGGVGIVPISAMWLASDNLIWLMFIQLVGGIAWAAYELAFFLLFFESIPEKKRTSVLTIYNLGNTVAWVAGSLLGGWLLHSMEASRAGYYALFALSTVGRGCALVLLARLPKMSVVVAPIGVRTLGVQADTTPQDAPILPSLPDQAPAASKAEVRAALGLK